MNPSCDALLTDLYQLTMAQAYLEQGMTEPAVFELFVRRLPPQRNFLLAAGLAQAVDYLISLRFSPDDIAWLEQTGRFSPVLLRYLEGLRFTGTVDAMPEGTVFFPHEPVLRVVAPMPQAQLVETRIMNLLNFQTMIASKAARSVLIAGKTPLIDFGLRRAHGAEAGLHAARASYLAGFTGTATVLAGRAFGIPIFGTMAHSFVQAHADEAAAFSHFAQAQPDNVVLLIDTYDTEAGARKVVALAPSLQAKGIAVKGVRLDSGDLAAHAHKVRKILDDGGLPDTTILASGNLDEYRLRDLIQQHAPIDSFAVGTAMTTSADAPSLDCAYKLQEYAGRPCRKRSEGKATWPGRKQIYREVAADGQWAGDLLTTLSDRRSGKGLLQPIMQGGQLISPLPSLIQSRALAAAQLAQLPPALRQLEPATRYEVRISDALRSLTESVNHTAH